MVTRVQTTHTHYYESSACASVSFIFSFYIGLLAHYSFLPGDKRSAHIKRLSARRRGLLSDVIDGFPPRRPRRDRCVRRRECFQTLGGYIISSTYIYIYSYYTLYIPLQITCVCVCVCLWFTPNEPVAGGGGLV